MPAHEYMFAPPRAFSVTLATLHQDIRISHFSKRSAISRPESSGPLILYRVPHKRNTYRHSEPAVPGKLKGIIKMPFHPSQPRTPKKKVRFNDVAKTESDRIWLGKTPKRAADTKQRSSRREAPPSPAHRNRAAEAGFVAGYGLSKFVAGSQDTKQQQSSRPSTPRRRDRDEQPAPPQSPQKPRRREKRPAEERPSGGEREAKRPRVVYGTHKAMGKENWVRVRTVWVVVRP